MTDGNRTAPRATREMQFFELNGSYLIPQDADPRALLADLGCFAEGADAVLQALADGLSEDGSQMQANLKDAVSLVYTAMFQVKMMANLANGADSLFMKQK